MNKLKYYLSFFMVFISSYIFSQNAAPFTWEFKTPQSKFVLMGSFHVGTMDTYPLDPRVEKAFSDAKNLVVEIDMSAVDPEAPLEWIKEFGTYSGKDTVEKVLPKDLTTKLKEFCKKNSLPWSMIGKYKPWVISTIIPTYQLMEAGFTANQGMDQYFINKANEKKKPIISLETFEFQMDMYAKSPETALIDGIDEMFRKPISKKLIDEMFTYWKNTDLEKFANFIFPKDLTEEQKKANKLIFLDRNKNWVKTIKELVKKGGEYFLIVGAGHFLGEGSLLDLLKNEGFQVNPLK